LRSGSEDFRDDGSGARISFLQKLLQIISVSPFLGIAVCSVQLVVARHSFVESS
jgi:hypothetical protein